MSRALSPSVKNSLSHRQAFLARKLSARPRNRLSDAVDCLLSARRFHARMIALLAARLRYGEAMAILAAIVEPDRDTLNVPGILIEAPSLDVLLWRLALRFGLRSSDTRGRTLAPLTLDDIRRSGTGESRLVLAAIGEIDWPSASRRERAAYCLNALTAFRRDSS
jgi:hypothetical protein